MSFVLTTRLYLHVYVCGKYILTNKKLKMGVAWQFKNRQVSSVQPLTYKC